jgi:hypothetical protein
MPLTTDTEREASMFFGRPLGLRDPVEPETSFSRGIALGMFDIESSPVFPAGDPSDGWRLRDSRVWGFQDSRTWSLRSERTWRF